MRFPLVLACVVAFLGCAAGPTSNSATTTSTTCNAVVHTEEAPPQNFRRIGEVTARCRGATMDDPAACQQTLREQACRMGATVVWAVTSSRTEEVLTLRGTAGTTP